MVFQLSCETAGSNLLVGCPVHVCTSHPAKDFLSHMCTDYATAQDLELLLPAAAAAASAVAASNHAVICTFCCRYPPGDLQQRQLFNYGISNPFKRGSGWLAWGLIGVAAAPLVVGAAAVALTAVGYESVVAGGRGTVDGVAGMISMDGPTYVRLLAVTGERNSSGRHRAATVE